MHGDNLTCGCICRKTNISKLGTIVCPNLITNVVLQLYRTAEGVLNIFFFTSALIAQSSKPPVLFALVIRSAYVGACIM